MEVAELIDSAGGTAAEHGDAFNRDHLLAAAVLRLRERFGLRHAIETGTYHGTTTEWLAKHFATVHSIEVNPTYFAQAAERLRGLPNVTLHEGSSAILLERLLATAPPRTLVFLDAHWGPNPLRGELACMARAAGARPLLMIHDFCVPGHPELGFDAYPDQGISYDWAYVADAVRLVYGDRFRVFYNSKAAGSQRGCCFVVPEEWLGEPAVEP